MVLMILRLRQSSPQFLQHEKRHILSVLSCWLLALVILNKSKEAHSRAEILRCAQHDKMSIIKDWHDKHSHMMLCKYVQYPLQKTLLRKN